VTAVTIFVPEISCDTCKNAIEGALRPLPGVREAQVDVAARQVRGGLRRGRDHP
jgi:copper chaperone